MDMFPYQSVCRVVYIRHQKERFAETLINIFVLKTFSIACPNKHDPGVVSDCYLVYGVEDVFVDVALCVHGQRVVGALVIVLQEDVLKGHGVLLLERHHHLVAEAKQHQLMEGGK
jgi:hypothetical protein